VRAASSWRQPSLSLTPDRGSASDLRKLLVTFAGPSFHAIGVSIVGKRRTLSQLSRSDGGKQDLGPLVMTTGQLLRVPIHPLGGFVIALRLVAVRIVLHSPTFD